MVVLLLLGLAGGRAGAGRILGSAATLVAAVAVTAFT
jgi:hypothetical protein